MDRKTMINFYKSRINPVRNVENKRNNDSQKLKIQRQDRRTKMFNQRRSIAQEDIENISENTSPNEPKDDKTLARKLALQKYRLEKEEIKRSISMKKKPPFIVGIPHHGNSPILKKTGIEPKKGALKTHKEARDQRMTRSHVKQGNARETGFVFKSPVRMFPFNDRKSVFVFQHNKESAVKKLTSPHTPTVLKRSARKIEQPKRQTNNEEKKAGTNLRAKVLKKTVQAKQKPLISSTEPCTILAAPMPTSQTLHDNVTNHSIQKNKSNIPDIQTLNSSSTSSTESISSLAAPLPDLEALNFINEHEVTIEEPSTSSQMPNSPRPHVSIKSEVSEEPDQQNQESSFQRLRVDKESARLLSLAEEWESINLKNKIPQDVTDEIDCLVGQTRLLTKDKFNQFRGLVDEFENQKGSHKITVEDLNGFWDMVYLQVEPLIKRYTKLEILKDNNWVELKPAIPAKKTKKGVQRKKVPKSSSNQDSTFTVKDSIQQEVQSMENPTEEKNHPQIHNLSRRSNTPLLSRRSSTPRTYSPAPYIAMRLSSVGRSLNVSLPTVDDPVESTTTPKSIIKKEIISDDTTSKKFVFKSTLEIGAGVVEYTPRRSTRLIGRSPVSLVKNCPSCQSPQCQSMGCLEEKEKNVTSRSRRSRKLSPLPKEKELEHAPEQSLNSSHKKQKGKNVRSRYHRKVKNVSPLPIEKDFKPIPKQSSNSSCLERKENSRKSRSRQSRKMSPPPAEQELEPAPKQSSNSKDGVNMSRKRFVLRPSKLMWNDSNKSPVPEKTRRTHFSGKENSTLVVENVETPNLIRRSTRLTSVKKVTFSASAEEKINFKLPSTPYGKKVLSQNSFSDSSSE